MIQSFLNDNYLQLCEDENQRDDFEYSENQLQIKAQSFQKKKKNGMIFIIEEIQSTESIYTYQGSCVFDELLEFYSFLNIYGVSKCEQEEKSE